MLMMKIDVARKIERCVLTTWAGMPAACNRSSIACGVWHAVDEGTERPQRITPRSAFSGGFVAMSAPECRRRCRRVNRACNLHDDGRVCDRAAT